MGETVAEWLTSYSIIHCHSTVIVRTNVLQLVLVFLTRPFEQNSLRVLKFFTGSCNHLQACNVKGPPKDKQKSLHSPLKAVYDLCIWPQNLKFE